MDVVGGDAQVAVGQVEELGVFEGHGHVVQAGVPVLAQRDAAEGVVLVLLLVALGLVDQVDDVEDAVVQVGREDVGQVWRQPAVGQVGDQLAQRGAQLLLQFHHAGAVAGAAGEADVLHPDRKSTRLNSSHVRISYAVFCLKKKKKNNSKHS